MTTPARPTAATDRCSVLARELREPLAGTAPTARAWLLVEEPGPWPSRAPGQPLRQTPDSEAMAALSNRFDELPIRLQWVRTVDRRHAAGGSRRVLLVHPRDAVTGARGWIERLDVRHAGELADLDPAALLAPTAPGIGTPHDEPVITVCTHAKKDACCATRGRPVAAALANRWPKGVWETTHLGGHRFAATLAMFPEGVLYGHVDVPEAVNLVDGHAEGRLDIAHLRGRSTLDEWQQAAEVFVRQRLDITGLADIRIGAAREPSSGRRSVPCATPRGTFEVCMERRPLGQPRLLGCAKDTAEDPGRFALVDLRARDTRDI